MALVLALPFGRQAAAQSPSHPAPQQMLAPGDSIRLIVWRQPELSGGFIVSPEQTLAHPLFQQVVVGGVPLDSARAHVAAALAKYVQDPQFVMEPFFRVAVIGEVRQPGMYALPRMATLIQAIAASGGPTESAQLDRVTLFRQGAVIPVDLTNFADPMANTLILSGDRVVVPRQRDILRNYIAPWASIVAAAAIVFNVLRR